MLRAISHPLIFLPALVSGIALWGGHWRRVRLGVVPHGETVKPHRVIVAGIAASSAIVGCAVYLGRAGGVTTAAAAEGALLASALGCCLPLLGYYAFGYLIRRRAALALVWLTSLFPLYICILAVGLGVAALANCPPNAYECPV
jgi:hypothetical protein